MASLPTPALRALTLTVTERCNLRCGYCYAPVKSGRRMSAEVATAAVKLFARQAAGQPRLTLSFFGGEPFLELDTMRAAASLLRRSASPGQQVRLMTPTHGLLLQGEALSFCRDEAIELALSVDGTERDGERCHPDGRDSLPELVTLLPAIMALDPAARIIARMTVTPRNVGRLASNVRGLSALGFRRIAVQPAFEQEWTQDAVEAWGREHRRIGTWLAGAAGAGVPVPELPWWRAIERRLSLGRPRSWCGAGVRVAAVSADGSLYPCFRFVFEQVESCRLGHVFEGFDNRAALERFAALSPEGAVAEQGECASCTARDGCVQYCPAMGVMMLGEPNRVPAVACRLMRAQVEAIRPYASMRRRSRRKPAPSRWAAAAFLAAAVTGAGSAASCGGEATTGTQAIPPPDAAPDQEGPGVCPMESDASTDLGAGGVCPVQEDAYSEGLDQYAGGLCPPELDASDEPYVGGQCPVELDAADDEAMGGLCPVELDAADDEAMGGLCPYPSDGQTPGIC